MDNEKLEEAKRWYGNNKEQIKKYNNKMSELVRDILDAKGLLFHSISNRLKEEDSFLEKCSKNKYSNLEEIMDVSGIRIIAYTNSDVTHICDVVKEEFKVDDKNSVNKADILESDRVGYLSNHFIVELDDKRAQLPEFKKFEGMKTEIQVRTLLQHMWAEIEHDKSYKFSGELPGKFKRRFSLLAGALELIDNEFDSLSNNIEQHKDSIKADVSNEELDIPIDSVSITGYLEQEYPAETFKSKFVGRGIIQELNAFGINDLQQFANILKPNLIQAIKKHDSDLSYTGLIRLAMIQSDSTKYFNVVFGIAGEGFHISNKLIAIAKEYNIDLLPIIDARMNKEISVDITK